MTAPRLEIDLDMLHHNARTLVGWLAARGISVTGVTKATLGSPAVARVLLDAGVRGLGESRIENIETLRAGGVAAPITLIRSPMPSQVDRVVTHANVSLNTEVDVIGRLSSAARAAGRTHAVVLMVELGDLREGIMPGDLAGVVRETLRLPSIVLAGIGTNLACQSGASPGAGNMAELSELAMSIESTFGLTLDVVSGGNSANLDWALGGATIGRIDDLRLGESILLGCEPLHRRPLDGLHTDAFTLVAEVIESKVKPSRPWGDIAQTAFVDVPPADGFRSEHGRVDGHAPSVVADVGAAGQAPDGAWGTRTIVALGRQDVDPAGLVPVTPDIAVLGASGDHLVLATDGPPLAVGSEVSFHLDYSALVRATTSPFVAKVISERTTAPAVTARPASSPMP
jgi:predicted amino acid racemase